MSCPDFMFQSETKTVHSKVHGKVCRTLFISALSREEESAAMRQYCIFIGLLVVTFFQSAVMGNSKSLNFIILMVAYE